jgi:RNA recognition motif-containing protein
LDDVPAAEGTQLFVTNLPISATWQKLKDHFKQVGDVDRANVKIGHGKPKFGTVRFYKKEDAARAIDEFNGVEMEGSALEIRLDHKV